MKKNNTEITGSWPWTTWHQGQKKRNKTMIPCACLLGQQWFKVVGLNFLFNCTLITPFSPLGPCVAHWANSGLNNRSILLSHGSFHKVLGIGGTNRLLDQDQFLLARVRREGHRNSIVDITTCFPFVEHFQHFASNNCAGENRGRCIFVSWRKEWPVNPDRDLAYHYQNWTPKENQCCQDLPRCERPVSTSRATCCRQKVSF